MARITVEDCLDQIPNRFELVLLGAGIGLLPDYAVKRELKDGRLVQVLRGWQFKKGVIAAVFPHRNYLAAKTRTLVEFLRSEFKEHGA